MNIENCIYENFGHNVKCDILTDKQRHNRNCIYVDTINGYDIYLLNEKYYYCPENE